MAVSAVWVALEKFLGERYGEAPSLSAFERVYALIFGALGFLLVGPKE